MPSVRFSERPSTSMSSRLTLYVVIRFSYAAAIALTSLHESAISVPPWSALYPPNDGITSPPIPRRVAMSDTYCPLEIGEELLPFQVGVHECLPSDWLNASVKYLAPDACAVLEMLG